MVSTYNECFDQLIAEWKSFASWKHPKKSIGALLIINIVWMYLKTTECTNLNLALWTILMVYIYKCVIAQIWTEARSPYQPEEQNPIVQKNQSEFISDLISEAVDEEIKVHEISISEISFFVEDTKTYLTVLCYLRKDSPGMFCLFLSSFFFLACYYGSFLSTTTLVYLITMTLLLLPITTKHLIKRLPERLPLLREYRTRFKQVMSDINNKIIPSANVKQDLVKLLLRYRMTKCPWYSRNFGLNKGNSTMDNE